MQLLNYKLNTLYYPGAGYDFSTLKYFMENSRITKYYFCDYMNFEITPDSILQELRMYFDQDYNIEIVADLRPTYFSKNKWIEYWHREAPMFGGSIANSFAVLCKIKKGKKIWDLIYFGTEAIQTYDVLVQNNIKFDVVVTQDHGLGGLWTTFCKDSKLEMISHYYNQIPEILFVGIDYESWTGFEMFSEPFGSFGLHQHERILYKFNHDYFEEEIDA